MRRCWALLVSALALAACASFPGGEADKQYELSLASGVELAMAWHGGPGVENAIFVQKLDAGAKPKGAPVRLTDGTKDAFEPDLQVFGGDMLIAWYEKDKANGATKAYVARLDAAGRAIWKRELSGESGNGRNAVVRAFGDSIHVAWIEKYAERDPVIFTETFGPQGKAKAPPRKIGSANSDTWNLNATIDGKGVFYVAYDAQLGTSAHELQLLSVDGDTVLWRALSAFDGHASLYPDIAISKDGQAALTWFDDRDGNTEIYLAVLPAADLFTKALPEQRLTHTPANSVGAYLTWNGDRLGVAWCDAQEGQSELYAQTFDKAGKPLEQIRRLTHTPAESSIPSIRPWRDGFAIAWNEYTMSNQGSDPTGHASITGSRAAAMVLK